MSNNPTNHWPQLPVADWTETLETFHLWTQIVGKIRMVNTPWINHSWSVPLYLSSRGLTTSLIPYGSAGFELTFDLLEENLRLTTTEGKERRIGLAPKSVATFYEEVMTAQKDVGMPVQIYKMPSEIEDAIPFSQDETHKSFNADHARALWSALLAAQRVMTHFRAGYWGKASPVHFFWGSFDLAVTRFSGRKAPPHGGGVPNFPDDVAREAYSHEVTSCGFWPGNRSAPDPIFYAYAYPTPEGFREAKVEPDEAFWLEAMGEFALPYEAVRSAPEPDDALRSFFETTHAEAAQRMGWNREELECHHPYGPNWWRERSRA